MLWLKIGFRRMEDHVMRLNINEVLNSREDWYGEIPQVIVDTSDVHDWKIGPLNQGTDKNARLAKVIKEPAEGLNKTVVIVEAHDRLPAQVIQPEEMERPAKPWRAP